MPALPLIIDTDTASDDAVALLLAAAGDLGDVRVVTTVAGNVGLPAGTRNALITLAMAGWADVPVSPGCARPVLRTLSSAQHVHGQDGIGDIGLPDPAHAAQPDHAVEVLLSQPRQHPGELTLVTLGPLTNLAAALLRDRDLLSRYRHVYYMDGAADARGNISATAEFNVWADPEAAAILLQTATPETVTWVGWDVSRRDAVMTGDEQTRLAGLGTPLATFAHRINRTVAEWAREVTGLTGYDLPDPVTMAVALRPDLIIEQEQVPVDIALDVQARGQMLIDHCCSAPAPNLTVVRRINETGFKDLLFDTCATNPQPT